jgi:hypothetical protein
MQANLNIGERFNGRGIIYVKRAIAQEVGILIVLVLLRNTASHAQGLEESQTSPVVRNSGRLRRAGRFTRWQLYRLLSRRLPGMTQRNVLPIASVLLRGCNGP